MAKDHGPSTADTYSFLFDLPQRVVTLACPEPYSQPDGTPHTITVVLNAPDKAVVGRPLADVIAENIAGWTLTVNGGQPAPITPAAMQVLPPDLYNWLVTEWSTQRATPLVARSSNGKSAPSPPSSVSPGLSLATPTPN
jgi:hypothetical protein